LKIYRALSLVDAIRERARKCRCKQKCKLPNFFYYRKERKLIEGKDNIGDDESNSDSN